MTRQLIQHFKMEQQELDGELAGVENYDGSKIIVAPLDGCDFNRPIEIKIGLNESGKSIPVCRYATAEVQDNDIEESEEVASNTELQAESSSRQDNSLCAVARKDDANNSTIEEKVLNKIILNSRKRKRKTERKTSPIPTSPSSKEKFVTCTKTSNEILEDQIVEGKVTGSKLPELKGPKLTSSPVNSDKKPFKCTHCEYTCKAKNNLAMHIRTHTGEKPYQCTECDYKCSQNSSLKYHMRMHTGEKPFQCTECGFRTSRKSFLNKHLKTHLKGNHKTKLTHDMRAQQEIDSGLAGVENCDESKIIVAPLLDGSDSNRPIQDNNIAESENVASNTELLTEQAQLLHTERKTSPKPSSLSCKEKFVTCTKTSNEILDNQIIEENCVELLSKDEPSSVNTEKTVVCIGTQDEIAQNSSPTGKVTESKVPELKDPKLTSSPVNSDKKRFQCTHCEYTCNAKNNLAMHIRTHTGEKPYQCTECDYKCCQHSSLKYHMRTHTGEKPFQCTECGFRTGRKSFLDKHLKTHIKGKPFMCTICGFKTSQQIYLTNHIKKHTEKTVVKKIKCCDLCGFKTNHKTKLTHHMRTHTDEKPFKCSMCDYRSRVKVALKRHQIVHSDEKPFQCTTCDFKTKHKYQLKYHMKIHSGEKPYQCTECDKTFRSPSNLKGHQKTHTRNLFSAQCVTSKALERST